MSDDPIRVLIVDDSPTARALLSALCSAESGITVVGEASNGHEAVAKVLSLRPSIVVMDIEMPQLDGIDAARAIMSRTPTPILVVTSAHDVQNVALSLRVVRAGGLRVIAKPNGPWSPQFKEEAQRFVLLVKALARVHPIRRRQDPPAADPVVDNARPRAPARAIGVAASTGGPGALRRFLDALPPGVDAPVLVVQHIAAGSVSRLTGWLSEVTGRPLNIAVDGEALVAGGVYFAPEERHLLVTAPGNARLSRDAPIGGFRPSASALFRSMAEVYGAAATAVVLTGMGSDGLDGARALHAAGAPVLAQDQETSAVFGMPKAVIEAGLTAATGPVEHLAGWLGSVGARRG